MKNVKNFWTDSAKRIARALREKGYSNEQIKTMSFEEIQNAVKGTNAEVYFKSERLAGDIVFVLKTEIL